MSKKAKICDGHDLSSQTCAGLGHFGGVLACTGECTFDESGCQLDPICGNGVAEGNEACDGDDFAGLSCENLGDFVGGTLQCSDACDLIGTLGCLSPGEDTPCGNDMDCPMEAPFCVYMTCWNGSETDPCQSPSECMEETTCVEGQCWDGSEGDPCYDNGTCSETVPFCGPDMYCYDGSEGDPCEMDLECIIEICVMQVCSLGKEGDPCVDDGDCRAPSPYCIGSTCYDGSEGDPCNFNTDCNPSAPHCENLNNTCQTGEPGSPCAENWDCASNSCNLFMEVCE